MNLIISVLLLLVACVIGGGLVYWLWTRGVVGRVCLLCLCWLGTVEAHSILYPQKQLKENYARVIG